MRNENQQTARLAGMWWLLFIAIGPISYLIIDGKLLVPDNTVATLNNINSNKMLFWAGVVAFLAGYTCFILLARALCKLFKPVSAKLTKWVLGLVIAGTGLVILGKTAEVVAANVGDMESATYLFNLRVNLEMVGEVFWGLWLIPLVILIFKSDLIPKAVGGVLILAAAYHLTAFGVFFASGSDVSTTPVLTILGMGELVVALWLVMKGVQRTSKIIEQEAKANDNEFRVRT